MLRCPGLLLATLLFTAASAFAQRGSVVFPVGTELPIRFLQSIESGRDTVGSVVVAQTMAALELDGCASTPAYTSLAGHVVESRGGRRFGRRGFIDIVFDSLRVSGKEWLRFPAVLDTLEYAEHHELRRNGKFGGARHSVLRRIWTASALGAAAATGIDEIPGAIVGLYWAARHGPRARILAGETGRVRSLRPLGVSQYGCQALEVTRHAVGVPALPAFTPHTTNRVDSASGDQFNVLFVGTRVELDSAFSAAGWVQSESTAAVHEVEAVITVIAKMHASHPPVSTQFFEGRAQDVAYELEGPNARMRHHIRFWQLDAMPRVWVGAATRDAGLLLKKRTHRVDPMIDNERELVVQDLEAGGAGALLDYVVLQGAQKLGMLTHGQRFLSDGRSAVIGPCFRLSFLPFLTLP